MSKKLLIIDDEKFTIDRVKSVAEEVGFKNNVLTANSVAQAFELWKKNSALISAVVLDLKIPNEGDGWTLLETFKKSRSIDDFEVLIYSGHLSGIKVELEAVRTQTITLYEKNEDEDHLWDKLKSLGKRVNKPKTTNFVFSPEEKAEIDIVAPSTSPVLILGSSGSGKTVKAIEVSFRSCCALNRIVHINCANLTNELADSELFGSLEGSFTGAKQNKLGKMTFASGFEADDMNRQNDTNGVSRKGIPAYKSKEAWGAVILDEIGALTWEVQGKILMVIEGEPMYPVGKVGAGFLPNFKVIAVTNELEKIKNSNKFRPDLLNRLRSTNILKCKELGDETDKIIREIIENTPIPIRLNGKLVEPIIPSLSEEGIQFLLDNKKKIQGGKRELNSIIERAFFISKSLPKSNPNNTLSLEDITKAWKPVEVFFSEFDIKSEIIPNETSNLFSGEEIQTVQIKIAEILNLEVQNLNLNSFRKSVREFINNGKNKDVLINELENVISFKYDDNYKKLGFALLGYALGIKSNPNENIEVYADRVKGRFTTPFRTKEKKVS